ncbi:VOC family protein [Corynebacterium lubricantis]|uniref:VOC family protein n=1 Tax=Corynebacterium lubricantis TaxID=541095 RepID=UPI00036CDCB1|nr:VOC family protein [Corynebacterium lubricantis]
MNQPQQAVTGQYTTNGTPNEYTSITPFLALADPAGAIKFYEEVFGATTASTTAFDGVIVHAEIDFPSGRLQLGAPSAETEMAAPDGSPVTFSLTHYCPNVDEVAELAEARGARVREPVAYFASGDRYCSLVDPFGVRWSIMTRVEDYSDAESGAKVNEFHGL